MILKKSLGRRILRRGVEYWSLLVLKIGWGCKYCIMLIMWYCFLFYGGFFVVVCFYILYFENCWWFNLIYVCRILYLFCFCGRVWVFCGRWGYGCELVRMFILMDFDGFGKGDLFFIIYINGMILYVWGLDRVWVRDWERFWGSVLGIVMLSEGW